MSDKSEAIVERVPDPYVTLELPGVLLVREQEVTVRSLRPALVRLLEQYADRKVSIALTTLDPLTIEELVKVDDDMRRNSMTMEEQKRIDAGRTQMAQEIVDGQAAGRPEMTVDDWKAFARNWIETAAQHATNESYYREQRDAAVRALKQIAQAGETLAKTALAGLFSE